LALVALSVVEQRLDAVRTVLAGASVTEVAAQVGVSRQSVHAWVGRYLSEGVAGLADRSSRPRSCPHQAPELVEQVVIEPSPGASAVGCQTDPVGAVVGR